MATATNDKPVRLGDLPVVKTNILENARQYDKGVVGGYSGTFPLTAASQGGIYLLPSTGKFYVCETAYNGAQISAPNSNFVELSVWKNHDRLTNLSTIVEHQYKDFNSWLDIPFPAGYTYLNSIVLLQHYSSNTQGFCNLKIHDNNRQFCANAINSAIETIPVQFIFIKKYN